MSTGNMFRFLRGGALLAAALLITMGRTPPAYCAQASFTVNAEPGTCDDCPQLTATVTVDPATGLWTVNLTQGSPAVPAPVTTSSATEQTSVTQSNPPQGGRTTNGPTLNATGFQANNQAGQMSGTSTAIVTGETADQGDSCQQNGDGLQDTDTSTTIIVTVTKPCPGGGGQCVYKIKFKATSDEGFTVSQVP